MTYSKRPTVVRFYLTLLLLLAGTAALAVSTMPAHAWYCPPGVPDTAENQRKGLCVDRKPTPKPTATAVATATSVPPATLVPPAVPTTTPQPPEDGPPPPPSDNRVSLCHYEPSTGTIETRRVQPDQVLSRLREGDWLRVGGDCGPTVVEATPLPTVAPIPMPTATPEPITPAVPPAGDTPSPPEGSFAPPPGDEPTPPETPMPPADDAPPPAPELPPGDETPRVPVQLPG
jgi:hypothetical protein